MSVSQRDSKAVIYGEVEALRNLVTRRDGQIAMQAETIARLQHSNAALTTQLQARVRHSIEVSGVRQRHLIMKRLAITLQAQVRWDSERGFECYEHGSWAAVPQRTLEFVTRDLETTHEHA